MLVFTAGVAGFNVACVLMNIGNGNPLLAAVNCLCVAILMFSCWVRINLPRRAAPDEHATDFDRMA